MAGMRLPGSKQRRATPKTQTRPSVVTTQQTRLATPAKVFTVKTTNYPTGTFTPKAKSSALPRPFQVPKSRALESAPSSLDYVVRLPGAPFEVQSVANLHGVEHTLNFEPAFVVDGGIKTLTEAIPKAIPQKPSVTRYRAVEIDTRTLKPGDDKHTQVLKQTVTQLRQQGAEVPEPKPGEGLYEYFRRKDAPKIWTEDNYPVRPVLVFRHFDELLKNPAGKNAAFDFMDLTHPRIPSRILKMSSEERALLNLQGSPFVSTVFAVEKELTSAAAENIRRALGNTWVYRFTP
ncbi:MAG: hypothetical protein K1X64_07245 [Myxococcaceae bacterium]|nr:hypothetical protein [Myxococcaceae bacterium]